MAVGGHNWRGVIERNDLPDLNPIDLCASHGLPITNAMFEHMDVHQAYVVPEQLRPKIDFLSRIV